MHYGSHLRGWYLEYEKLPISVPVGQGYVSLKTNHTLEEGSVQGTLDPSPHAPEYV